VTRAMRRQWSSNEDESSGLANFLVGVHEAQMVIVFAEKDDGTVDVSLRAVPHFNVADVAVRLGGGGHPLAAGCTLQEDLPRARERVLAEARKALAEQKG